MRDKTFKKNFREFRIGLFLNNVSFKHYYDTFTDFSSNAVFVHHIKRREFHSIIDSILWSKTKEGQEYWEKVYRYFAFRER